LLATSPVAALALLVICASIASWGLCLSTLCRNPRPFEMLLLLVAYLAMQGMPVFDIALAPQVTLAWHGLLLLPAWAALAWAWPRLAGLGRAKTR
jgi:ABC-type polysaccharide/polyol phosphate export permease